MKKAILAVAIILACYVTASAQTKRTLSVNDYIRLQEMSDPQLSPDKQWIAFSMYTHDAKKDDWNRDVYMIPFQGGNVVRLTSYEKDDSFPRWSPDNKYLGFLSKRKGKKQVFLLPRTGGEAMQLTDFKGGVSAFSWSPDGKKLALIVNDPDPEEKGEDDKKDDEEKPKPIVLTRLQFLFDEYDFLKELYSQLYVFDIETKTGKQLTTGPYDVGAPPWSGYDDLPEWSPDGSQILFISNRSENADANRNTDIFVVPAAGGEIRKLTTNEGGDEEAHWSPDGKSICYQAQSQPDLIWYDTVEIATIPAAGGSPRILTRELDRNGFQCQFSSDGKRVFFLLEDHGTQRLASVSVNGGEINKNIAGENAITSYDAGSGDSIAFLASRPELPNEIFAYSNGKSRQVSSVHAELLKDVELGHVDRVQYKSKDGTQVEAFVVKPPQFQSGKKYPLLLWIHGGPTSQYAEDFYYQAQLFAANDYVVLLPNPRGSTGYGEDFCKAIWADWGNKDYDDVTAGVDHLIAQGYVDPEKLGVGGWSYGGMLTDHVITKTTRFKAAASGASELNYLMNYGTDHYQYEWEKEIGLPWEKPEAYTKISPFFSIHKVKTPTLIMCGEKDWNVPLINSEQLYQALRRLGVDTMLIVYPGEYHGFSVPSYELDRFERYLAWFGHYVQALPNKVPSPAMKTLE